MLAPTAPESECICTGGERGRRCEHVRTHSSGLLRVTISVVATVSVTMYTEYHLHRRRQHSKKKKRAGRSILSCPVLSSASIVVVERDRSWCTRVVTEAEDDTVINVNVPGGEGGRLVMAVSTTPHRNK